MAVQTAPWRNYRYPVTATEPSVNNQTDLDDTMNTLKRSETDMQPGAFGGVFKSTANEPITYERDATSVPPDVPKNTRILAIYTLTQDDALPRGSGWMLSDFLAFYHLFQN
ncbi:hypothetical protein LHYA1_G007879 [Lachnellula hyalina]|uniref:Uncharacterized protein n=1 Tax=Lachnellula hyalina TaxID=1316788 RepID=A0A8H8TVA2_9HELO|nr:uncharacterized protein LHYA1_G007879 [Lachnellula hyalina]TVY23142.1 hypothetical protein LHYA1_G007879 [Lachnellula hyalina]